MVQGLWGAHAYCRETPKLERDTRKSFLGCTTEEAAEKAYQLGVCALEASLNDDNI
jgi:hypothetical protein